MIWLLPMSVTLYYTIHYLRLIIKEDKYRDTRIITFFIEATLFIFSTVNFFKKVIFLL